MLVGVYVDEDACKGCMQDLGDGNEGQPCSMKESSYICMYVCKRKWMGVSLGRTFLSQ